MDTGTSRARSRAAAADPRRRQRRAPLPSAAAIPPPPPAGRTAGCDPPGSLPEPPPQTGGADLARDVIQHAVHEAGGFLAAEPARDLHRLVQGDGGGDLRTPDALAGG